jgi:hypothetical protein
LFDGIFCKVILIVIQAIKIFILKKNPDEKNKAEQCPFFLLTRWDRAKK